MRFLSSSLPLRPLSQGSPREPCALKSGVGSPPAALPDLELFDFAHQAILHVSDITTRLAQERKHLICGKLGVELFLVATYLENPPAGEEEWLRRRVPKLLRQIERLCCVRTAQT